MLITISLLILVYTIMGKDISGLLEKVKNKITPEINAKVKDTLNKLFVVEYGLVEG